MRANWVWSLAVVLLFLGFSSAGMAGEPKSSAKAKAKAAAVQPVDLTTAQNTCPAGSRQDPVCLEKHAKDASACPCEPVAAPDPGARKVKSGTIKLECPAGTDKLCNGNDCGCWTRNE